MAEVVAKIYIQVQAVRFDGVRPEPAWWPRAGTKFPGRPVVFF